MKIVFTSDTHGRLTKEHLPPGDILCLAGDILPNFSRNVSVDAAAQEHALRNLDTMLGETPFKHVIFVAGNHDWIFEVNKSLAKSVFKKCIYLEDSGITLEGIKFYGSPWQPWFYDWAFNFPKNDGGKKAKEIWGKIPEDVDVLITHGPPKGILDQIKPALGAWDSCGTRSVEHIGCPHLAEKVELVKPKIHAFGHIHGSYGKKKVGETLYLNCALCDETYSATNKPHVVELSAVS